jgi:hypothetical protein
MRNIPPCGAALACPVSQSYFGRDSACRSAPYGASLITLRRGRKVRRPAVLAAVVDAATSFLPSLRLVPQTEETGAVPMRAGYGERDLAQALVGLAVPGEAIVKHHDAMRHAFMLADKQRARPNNDPGSDANIGTSRCRTGAAVRVGAVIAAIGSTLLRSAGKIRPMQ